MSIGLDTAVKALRAHQLAVDVASHNIANAQTPGFSRQRVLLRPIGIDGSDHFTRDNLLGRAGMGVDAKDVNRIRDTFLDFQARQSISSQGQFASLATPLGNAEVVFNDPSDDGISALLGKFWAAWHDVVNEPESSPRADSAHPRDDHLHPPAPDRARAADTAASGSEPESDRHRRRDQRQSHRDSWTEPADQAGGTQWRHGQRPPRSPRRPPGRTVQPWKHQLFRRRNRFNERLPGHPRTGLRHLRPDDQRCGRPA
ncbi:MAG: hypothetical protein IPI85_04865 [Dehalococcoidia bacterium]|nr:hypothetical protein [Dehalococcoidia bacterium]